MGICAMPIIDSQVHAYERDHPGRPWAGVLAGPPEVTGDDMAAAMDAVGIGGAGRRRTEALGSPESSRLDHAGSTVGGRGP